MPIIEDFVKKTLKQYLEEAGYVKASHQLGTRRGHDVEAVDPRTQRRLVIECKGEARGGNQLHRSWPNVASALLTSILEAETSENEVGMGFPDTREYNNRLQRLKPFCKREGIRVFWVNHAGNVREW